jgi:hypothetical protein
MASRDKYGNYVNNKGVTIKIGTDKNTMSHLFKFYVKVEINYNNIFMFFSYHNI